jgi:tripartite-type tricarboxylate transporter receptor subunit TctC
LQKGVWKIFTVLAAVLTAAPSTRADETNFYFGKTIRIVVGYGPGSIYDAYARILAQYAGRRIAGNPRIVVEDMTGAGSLSALNYVVNVAPQDGAVVAAIGATLPFGPLLGEPSARFDPMKLNWLPSPGSETSILTVWHTAPVKSLDDARSTELVLGSNAQTGSSSLYGRLLNEVLGLKIRLVYGYSGGVTEALLATERGEVQGHPSVSWATLKAHPDWLRDHKIRFLTYFGGPRNSEIEAYDGAVYAEDRVPDGDKRQLWDIGMAPSRMGRPYVMGPGVPADRVAMIADAFLQTWKDPGAKAAAARQNLDIDPLSSEEVRAIVAKTYASPPDAVAKLKALFGERQ